MKILNTKDQDAQKLKVLIGGFSASGKTTLAKTIDDKCLVISAESGLLVLQGTSVDYIDLSKSDDGASLNSAKQRLSRLADIFTYLQSGKHPYKSVFLDSLTEIGDLVLEQLQEEYPDPKHTLPMFGHNKKKMRSIIKKFRDLPLHVYMTCITKFEKDDNNKRFMAFSLPGSISDELPQYFNEIFYVHVDAEGKRSLVTKANDTLIYCRDRSNKLQPIEEPDLGAIARKILILEEKKEK